MKLFLVLGLFVSVLSGALASTVLNYSGRLVNANGSPVSGTVTVRFELFYSSDVANPVCTLEKTNVALAQGVFHANLNYAPANCVGSKTLVQVVEDKPAPDSLLIRVRDVTNNKTYGHQALNAMPFAILADRAKTLGPMGATTAGQVLRWDGSQWIADTIDEVAAGSIGTPELADNSVTSAKIQDLTITGADVADGSLPQSKITGLAASLSAKENALSITTSDNYLDGTKVWRNFEASVRSAFLTGFSSGPALPVVPGDSVLTALGKLDASITSVQAVSGSYVARNGSVSMTGNLNLDNNRITNLATPTLGSDAATMEYVDSKSTQWSLVGDDVYYTPGGVGVGVGVLEPSAIFQVTSDNKGVLIARMTEAQRNAIASPANGLLIYNTSTSAINFYDGVTTSWRALGVAGAGAPPSGAAGGDLEGTYPNPTLKSGIAQEKITNLTTDLAAKLDDSQLDTTTTLGTDNTKIPSQGAVKAYVDGAVTSVNIGTKPVGGDLSGTVAAASVIKLQGRDVVTTAPGANQVLKWNGSAWAPADDNDTMYTLPNVGTAGTYGSATVVPVITTDAQGRVTGVVNTPITGAAPTGTAGGDLEGSYPNPTLKSGIAQSKITSLVTDLAAKLDDSQLDTTATLGTDNTKIPSQAAVKTYVDGAVSGANIGAKPVGGDLSGTVSSATVIKLQGRDVVSTLPSTNQVLKWNGAAWAPANDVDTTAPTGAAGGDLDGTYPDPTIKAGLPATRLSTGLVDNTEFNYLDGVTSSIQTQFAGKLSLAGGTLTGPLTLPANPTLALEAATKQYVDSGIATAASKWTTSGTDISNANTGNVGIGTSSPSTKLHVRGDLTIDKTDTGGSSIYLTGASGGISFKRTSTTGTIFRVDENSVAASSNFVGMTPMGSGFSPRIYATGSDATIGLRLSGTNGGAIVLQDISGNVGVGTSNPLAKLDVAGQVRITGGSPAAGKVLTSDASGVATWETPAAAGITALTGDVTGTGPGSTATTIATGVVTSAKIADGTIVNADVAAGAAIDASKIASGNISNAEFETLNGVTTNIQTQLNSKEGLLGTGTASQFLNGLKAWTDFGSTVRGTTLAGFNPVLAVPVTSSDTVMSAIEKLEASIASINSGAAGAAANFQYYSAPGSYTYTVPSGITAVEVTVAGGGGAGMSGGSNAFANSGAASSFGVHCTASGGQGGRGTSIDMLGATHGNASGGDFNLIGGGAPGGRGGVYMSSSSFAAGDGGNGGLCRKIVTLSSGSTVTVTVGAGGVGSTGVPYGGQNGVNGYVIVKAITGSGDSAVASPWTLSGANVAFNSGNVGIGTNTPPAKLTVTGSSVVGGANQTNISAFTGSGIRLDGSISNSSQDGITYQSGGGGGAALVFRRDGSYGTNMDFYTNNAMTPGALTKAMSITNTGDVAVGPSAPTAKLDVQGSFKSSNSYSKNVVASTSFVSSGTLASFTMTCNGGPILIFANFSAHNGNNAWSGIGAYIRVGSASGTIIRGLSTTSHSASTVGQFPVLMQTLYNCPAGTQTFFLTASTNPGFTIYVDNLEFSAAEMGLR